ncbi:hypothetical protein B0H19DRAFT_1073633 [Mycena capillaripes]|nr:hypothetical protein B0H19DRAFT_1073633 [Mycena capillaripes]
MAPPARSRSDSVANFHSHQVVGYRRANSPRCYVTRWRCSPTATQSTRALKVLVDALSQNSAFEVVEYVPFKHFEASELVHQLYFVDGGAHVRETAAGRRADPTDHTIHELWDRAAGRARDGHGRRFDG